MFATRPLSLTFVATRNLTLVLCASAALAACGGGGSSSGGGPVNSSSTSSSGSSSSSSGSSTSSSSSSSSSSGSSTSSSSSGSSSSSSSSSSGGGSTSSSSSGSSSSSSSSSSSGGTTTYSINGTISGLAGGGLVLKDSTSGMQTAALAAGTPTFSITGVPSGTTYAVVVATQPSTPTQHCTVINGTGTVTTSNATGVSVYCAKVGQYIYLTNPYDGNTGSIAAFTINQTSGALTAVPNTPYVSAQQRPFAVTIDPAGQFAYVANYGSATISTETIVTGGALAIDTATASTGASTNQPQSLAYDTAGPYLYVGSNDSPSGTVEAYTVTAGALTPVGGTLATGVFADGNVPVGLALDPTDSFLYSTDVNDSKIVGYTISGAATPPAGGLTPLANSPFTGLIGPSHIAMHPTGKWLYVTDISGGTVGEFSIAAGELTGVNDYAVGHSPEAVAVDPTGTYLYVSNSADATVSAFVISPTDGSLTAVPNSPFATLPANTAGVPTVNTPTWIAIDPSGQFLYVANGDAGTVTPFTIGTGGALTPIGPSNALTPVQTFINNEGPSSAAIY